MHPIQSLAGDTMLAVNEMLAFEERKRAETTRVYPVPSKIESLQLVYERPPNPEN
jgi:hypothetical protein